MEKITWECPECGKQLSAPEDKAGKRGRCPGCRAVVQVPTPKVSESGTQNAPDSVRVETGQSTSETPAVELNLEMNRVGWGYRGLEWVIDTGAILAIQMVLVLTPLPWLVVFVLYYCILERTGRTLGKVLVNTRVARDDGGPPELQQLLVRTLCRLIPFDPLSAFSRSRRMWHDSLSATMVVRHGRIGGWRLVALILAFCISLGLVCLAASLRQYDASGVDVRLNEPARPFQDEQWGQEWKEEFAAAIRETKTGQLYSVGSIERMAQFFADNHVALHEQYLGRSPDATPSERDFELLGAYCAEEAFQRGQAILEEMNPSLCEEVEEILAQALIATCSEDDLYELVRLESLSPDQIGRTELQRIDYIIGRAVDALSSEDRKAVKEYFSVSAILGLDAMQHEIDRDKL